MADKPVTVRRERIGHKIGCLRDQDMARLGIALAFVSGFAMLWVLSTNRKILVRLTAV